MTLTLTDGELTLSLIGCEEAGAILYAPAYHTNTPIAANTVLSDGIRTIIADQDLPAGSFFICDENIPQQLTEPVVFFFREP